MADTSNLSNFLEDVADAIRTKKETTEKIPAANFDTEILNLNTGSDTSDATATIDDILVDKTAYIANGKVTGNIEVSNLTRSKSVFGGMSAGTYSLNCSLIPDTNYMVVFDYTNWKICIRDYSVSYGSKDDIAFFDISTLGINKPTGYNYENRSCVSVSQLGMFGEPNGCMIYIGLYHTTSFAITYNVVSKQFLVSLNGSVTNWFMPTTTHVSSQEEPRSGKVAFIGTNGKAVTLSYDDNSYVRLYNLTFTKTGDVTRNCPYYDESSGQHIGKGKYGFGGLTLHNNEAIQYYLTGRNYIFYYVNNDLVKGTNEQSLFISPSFQKGIMGTTLYDIIPDINNKTYTKTVRTEFPELANYTIWRFLNEYTVLARSNNGSNNQLDVIRIDYDTNTMSILNSTLGYQNDEHLYTDWNNVIQGIQANKNLNFGKNLMPEVGISKLYRQSINYFNTEDSDTNSSNVLLDKIAYSKYGKIQGSMPNNGELNYEVSTSEQTIPEGYTSGGTIAASPLTNGEYNECLEVTQEILGQNVSL